MKEINVQKQVVGWENYVYMVPDDFNDYKSLIHNNDWVDYDFIEDSTEETGLVEIYDENFNEIEF